MAVEAQIGSRLPSTPCGTKRSTRASDCASAGRASPAALAARKLRRFMSMGPPPKATPKDFRCQSAEIAPGSRSDWNGDLQLRKPRMPDDLISLTATAAVALLRGGKVSPLELVEAAAARIAEVDGAVNAMPTLCLDRARAHASALMAGRRRQ